MEDKIFLLSKLNDDSIQVVLETYENIEAKFETSRLIVDSALDDDSLSDEHMSVVLNTFKRHRNDLKVISLVVDELYRLYRKDLFEIKKTLTSEERNVDKVIIDKIRKDFEDAQKEDNEEKGSEEK